MFFLSIVFWIGLIIFIIFEVVVGFELILWVWVVCVECMCEDVDWLVGCLIEVFDGVWLVFVLVGGNELFLVVF